ncbi:aminodeoxychorismate synthase component I [Novosphingobium resinovorum]|uniref:aminodeoxychorismate synthase component I n=1 Tax=Sphingomonadaceae TaxID=41297 RepID=UPI00027CC703|nr:MULTISPECIES: aminodeoxychorismate synthase component I [Sphingomonadaceae]EJU14908.1 para-aminobenzoate synthase, component I [Sphingomonas sp. LH128]MBF7012702.1 aminodeoxychorismate synthase component I [Novosphingobium sp. HR1a]WJM27435.1 aminodeoxychorismate synthase component I [Novosphingobium resinovorum]
MTDPFVLLDDARSEDAADARLYRGARETVVAMRGDEVLPALERLQALSRQGLHLAGYMTYEAGLALEPRLAGRLRETGAPLLWFGAFDGYETLSPSQVPLWLAARAGPERPAIGPLEPQVDLGSYERAFAAIHGAIQAGDIYQANLTLPLAGPWSGDPLALYAALGPRAAAGYGAVIHDGARWHLSFSPELFFSLSGREAEVRPMKGTRPRGRDAAGDAALAADLAASTKDRAENLMILDLMRNDLSRVAEPGSVRVENPFAIESYPTVHQMVSTVRATLPEGRGGLDLLRALFPCGSITGAPKIRAMELIAEAERTPRGLYCGSIGYLEPSGDAAFNVAIRTLRLDRDGRAVLGVGSAVVADSQALPEWRECLVKGGFVRESQVQVAGEVVSPASFDLIETMRFTPEDGIALLEPHLERIAASAATLGFGFDRHAVRNAIQALCFEAEAASKLRLVVGRTGAFSLELSELPAPLTEPATVAVLRLPVDSGDWRLAHKTTDRGFYDKGLEVARANGADEAILLRDDGLVTEGCFTNLFVERGGMLLTPPATLGLLPGVLRRSLLDSGRAVEAQLTLDDLAGGFFIGNALRGLIPARLL